MNEHHYNTERIEKYLEGKLTKDQLKEFEANVGADAELAHQLSLQTMIIEGAEREGLKDELNQIHHKLYGNHSGGGMGFGTKAFLSVLFIGIVAVGIWFFSGTDETVDSSQNKSPESNNEIVKAEAPIEDSNTEVVPKQEDVILTTNTETVLEPEPISESTEVQSDETISRRTFELADLGNPEHRDGYLDEPSSEAPIEEEEIPESTVLEGEIDEEVPTDSPSIATTDRDSTAGNYWVRKPDKTDEPIDRKTLVKEEPDLQFPFDSLRALLNTVFPDDPSSTTTKIGDPKMFLEFKGKRGTFVSVPPNTLVTASGERPVGNIKIEIKEYYEPYELVARGLATISDDRILESGGVVHIAAVDENNNELQVKSGAKIGLSFVPEEEYKASPGFKTFYGTRDTVGLMNWSLHSSNAIQGPANDVTPISGNNLNMVMGKSRSKGKTRTIQKFEKYINLEAASLGWINCDKFSNKKTTRISAMLSNTPENAAVFIIFKDMESVLMAYVEDDYLSFTAPAKQEVWVIGMGTENGADYYFIKETNTSKIREEGFLFEKAPQWKIKQAMLQVRFKDIKGLDKKPKADRPKMDRSRKKNKFN